MVKVIAEFCQNHNGDMGLLKDMIHQAAEAGAHYAKIQTIFAEDVAFREQFEEGSTDANGEVTCIKRPFKPEVERLKKLELTYDQQADFVAECKKVGMVPFTTCFTRGSIPKILELGMTSIKVASYDCGALPLLRDLTQAFDDLIVSTGATYDREIEASADLLKKSGKKFSFLHCVTIYPTPLDQINLNRMNYLKTLAGSTGLSEHTLTARDGVKASLAAIHDGAEFIERHFTILAPDQTRDGPVSILPRHIKELNEFARLSHEDQARYIADKIPEYQSMKGTAKRELSKAELLNRDYYRGRFATHTKNGVVYNWEDKSLT